MLFGSSRPYPRIRRSVLSKFCRFVYFHNPGFYTVFKFISRMESSAKKPKKHVVICSSERATIVELVEKYKNILENKRTDAVSSQAKTSAWKALADRIQLASASTIEPVVSIEKRWDNTCKWDNSNPRSTYWFISSHFFEWEVRCASDVYSILIFFWIRRLWYNRVFFWILFCSRKIRKHIVNMAQIHRLVLIDKYYSTYVFVKVNVLFLGIWEL